MTAKPKLTRPDIPLSLAAQALSQICTAIEEDLEPDAAVAATFADMKTQLAKNVDVCVLFNSQLVSEIERARETYRAWRQYAARLESVHEAYKASVKLTLEANPDVPYKGALGSVAVQKSPPKVVTQFAETELDHSVVELFGIDAKYIRVKTTYELNNKTIKEDLGHGIDIPWAKLEQGSHVRFREAPIARAKDVTPKLEGGVDE